MGMDLMRDLLEACRRRRDGRENPFQAAFRPEHILWLWRVAGKRYPPHLRAIAEAMVERELPPVESDLFRSREEAQCYAELWCSKLCCVMHGTIHGAGQGPDNDWPAWLMLNRVAADLFGVSPPPWLTVRVEEVADEVARRLPLERDAMAFLLQELYDSTQAYLASEGISRAPLIRGLRLEPLLESGVANSFHLLPLSFATQVFRYAFSFCVNGSPPPSWWPLSSPDWSPAVFRFTTPRDRILWVPETSPYGIPGEVLAIGGETPGELQYWKSKIDFTSEVLRGGGFPPEDAPALLANFDGGLLPRRGERWADRWRTTLSLRE